MISNVFNWLATASLIVSLFWAAMGFGLIFYIPGAFESGVKTGTGVLLAIIAAWGWAGALFWHFLHAQAVKEFIGRTR